MKKTENLRFFGVFKPYKMGTLARNGVKFPSELLIQNNSYLTK